MMNDDIILVTIDALRHDATDHMPKLKHRFGSEGQGEVITAGAATNWVFPAILAGSYYPRVYNESGLIKKEFQSLPDILQQNGYSTGAFLGFNPYLSKWEDRFEHFWNGGIAQSSNDWYSNSLQKWLSRLHRTTLLRKRVPGTEVLERSQEWYRKQSQPRFLWIHLMEPHGPYYPGLQRAKSVGLFRAYRSVLSFERHGDETPMKHIETQRQLYNECVEKTDSILDDFLSSVNEDATIVIIGDHGEEFDHGHYDHERLYDECVRVPMFSKNLFETAASERIRQIDLPSILLSRHGIDVPSQWDGESTLAQRPAYMLTPRPSEGTFQFGLRKATEKLIRTYDQSSGNVIRNEYYDLATDPKETNNRYSSEDIDDLGVDLQAFIDDHRGALDIEFTTGIDSPVVEDRLERLGYK